MNIAALQSHLDEVFDHGFIHHGFTDYMRNYEMIVLCKADPRTGIAPANVRLLFKHCVIAEVETAIPPHTWELSLDDRLIDYETGVDLDGYVWGVKWQLLYPGASIVGESERAQQWTQQLGIQFHEVRVETNGHNLNLVFADLRRDEVPVGYTPFSVGDDGPDSRTS